LSIFSRSVQLHSCGALPSKERRRGWVEGRGAKEEEEEERGARRRDQYK